MSVAFRTQPLCAALVLSLVSVGCHQSELLGEDAMNAGAGAGMGAGMSGDGDAGASGEGGGGMTASTSGAGGAGMGGSGGVTMGSDDPSCSNAQVAVGVDSTCAVSSEGLLSCWGRDVYSDEPIAKPESITSIMGMVRAVTLGSGHICALVEEGYVWCWGKNWGGQLGSGSLADEELPRMVPELSDVEQIDAGFDHTCALKRNGEVWCWGKNRVGVIGSNEDENVPLPVALWTREERAVQISAGYEHTCLRDEDDRVHCIGSNSHGQLGDGTTISSGEWVSSNLRASDISAGFEHTCAVGSDSYEVWCWGANGYGQLGEGTGTGSIMGMPNGHTMPVFALDMHVPSTVHAGHDHTCAAPRMGTVKCWGSNQFGALGYGQGETIGEYKLRPVDATLLDTSVKAYAAGASHSCAIYGNGELVCWGANGFGAVGDGTLTDRYEPVTITGIACE